MKRLIFSCNGKLEKDEGFYNFNDCQAIKGNPIKEIWLTNLEEFKAKGTLKKAIKEAMK